jgi:hypothetical protein
MRAKRATVIAITSGKPLFCNYLSLWERVRVRAYGGERRMFLFFFS